MLRPLSLLLLLLPIAVGCGDVATAEFPITLQLSLDASDFSLPQDLRQNGEMGPRVAELPCNATRPCPPEAGLECNAQGFCDPLPQSVSMPLGDVVDLDEHAGALLRVVDSMEILSVEYQVQANTLNVDTTAVEFFWGPPGAVTADPAMGTQLLGVLPAVAAAETGSGAASLDAAGNTALTTHFETVSHSARFFGKTSVDLAPGGAFPEGRLDVTVTLRIRLSGSLL